jgi:hypothetical protein
MSVLLDPAKRKEDRDKRIREFLQGYGISPESLSKSTLQCLHDWARQVQLVENQDSANYKDVIKNLCSAVESELAAGLGSVKDLEFLAAPIAIGQKAKNLQNLGMNHSLKQRLKAHGLKPGAVLGLKEKLSDLAKLRSSTGSAHGAAKIMEATQADAKKAQHLSGRILRDSIPTKGPGKA